MSYIRDTAIVLKKEPFRDHDRRYVLYGREHGLIVAIARGASRILSKQAGHLEPFHVAEVMVAPGRGFDHLAVARNLPGVSRPPFAHVASYAILGGLSDLIISLTRQGVSDDRIFNLVIEVSEMCVRLPEEPTLPRARFLAATATLQLIDLLGFGPSFADTSLSPQALTLVRFMRRFPIADAIRVSALTDCFDEASSFVETSLRHTPLSIEPHTAKTIHAMCR